MVEARLWAEILSLRRRNKELQEQVGHLQDLLGALHDVCSATCPGLYQQNYERVQRALEAPMMGLCSLAEQDLDTALGDLPPQGLYADAVVQTDACEELYAQLSTSFGSLEAGPVITPTASLIPEDTTRHRLDDTDVDNPAMEDVRLWVGEVTVSAETYNDLLRSLSNEVTARRKLEEENALLRKLGCADSGKSAEDTMTPDRSSPSSCGSSPDDGSPIEELSNSSEEPCETSTPGTKEHIICAIGEDIKHRRYSLDEFLDIPDG